MMGKLSIRKVSKILFICVAIIFAIGFLLPQSSHAVPLPAFTGPTWAALPPYNTLWPLWSPTLSPIDPVTLLPVPIVSSLAPNTVLPLQPGLTLDPRKDYPYLLYNTPLGMAYYDPLWGVNLWPAPDLVDPVLGIPLPIDLSLILGWSTIAPTSSTWLVNTLPVANSAYYNAYDAFAVAYEISLGGTLSTYPLFASLINPAPAYSSLLTPLLILGP
ncbi:MAG: hypothetical protein ACMUIP_10105 [bacterium]